MKRYRILAIDDVRECGGASILARNYSDGLKCLTQLGPWDELWLDHDLGYDSVGVDGREQTGYHILEFLENNQQYRPGQITLITSNPAGRQRMEVVLERLGYDKNTGKLKK